MGCHCLQRSSYLVMDHFYKASKESRNLYLVRTLSLVSLIDVH